MIQGATVSNEFDQVGSPRVHAIAIHSEVLRPILKVPMAKMVVLDKSYEEQHVVQIVRVEVDLPSGGRVSPSTFGPLSQLDRMEVQEFSVSALDPTHLRKQQVVACLNGYPQVIKYKFS
jgi:hypothetical protein